MSKASHQILDLISKGESIALEFKSDAKCLSDRDLVAAVVSLANSDGGELLLGVEDNGELTGLHPNHCDVSSLPALVSNRTNPPITVRAEALDVKHVRIARISVPKSRQLVSTSEGLLLRRRLKLDGTPESVPFYPHEFLQRQSTMGIVDPSAMPLSGLGSDQLDPLQRLRIRNTIKRYGGDQSLLPLADEELDGALGLVTNVDGMRCPTVAGLLLLGNESLLRQHLPSHEIAFQVLRGTEVQVNEFFRKPLLETFEEIETLFRARLSEEEIQLGLFRVAIPNFERRAFREAVVNALVHRDYNSLGAVHVKFDSEGISISNPGGFVEGISLNNILVADPRSRNPLLADIIKRMGLAERTGRGIDRIYEGLLRYGRSSPDYSMSSPHSVVLRMPSADADLNFLKMIVECEEQTGESMPIDSLIILSRLREERRLTTPDLAQSVQKNEIVVRSSLEKLVESGFIEAHGSSRGRAYTLSAKVYRHTGQKAAYVRQAGFDPIQQEQMIISYINKHGSIRRSEAMELCQISQDQAYKLLARMKKKHLITMKGRQKGASYTKHTAD